MSQSVQPYLIAVDQAKIDRLKQKLALTDLPPEVEGTEPWTRGVPLREMKRILHYWSSSYDWRETEVRLNESLPQFTTDIAVDGFDTYTVHFVHQKSKVENAIPLLFMHGWPGNFTEVEKILPLLTSGNGTTTPAFHVVSPSLIDHGFSDRAAKAGFNILHHGHAYHALMLRLGYEKYVIQGGDTGSFIARIMVQHYSSFIGGHLLNLTTPRQPTKEQDPDLWERIQNTPLTAEEQAGMQQATEFSKSGTGYFIIQATKPQTIGYSVTDSPAGLLAWIYEKMHDWSDNYPWTPEEILQWVCIYYFSKPGANASQHTYFENSADFDRLPGNNYSSVPLGVARFPRELASMPRLWHETLGPIVFWKVHAKGGHFAAWERPQEIVEDLREMFGRGGGAEACCGKGRTGYLNEH